MIDRAIKGALFAAAGVALTGSPVFAGGNHGGGHGHGPGPSVGQAGYSVDADRVIEVNMGEMFFSLDELSVSPGETIRFVVNNTGRVVHEFNIGTSEMHRAHEAEMRAMKRNKVLTSRTIRHDRMRAMGMTHDDPNSALLEPGESAEVVWTFDGDAPLVIACNVPGHRQSGMRAEIVLDGSES